jgi:hypothetical protein
VRKISAPLGAGSSLAELEIPESKKNNHPPEYRVDDYFFNYTQTHRTHSPSFCRTLSTLYTRA